MIDERYEKIDMLFYKRRIAPMLPPKTLDFHTHIWMQDQWLMSGESSRQKSLSKHDSASLGIFKTAKYMATELEYTVEQLLDDGHRMFPDREYQAVCFGQPTPAVNIRGTNSYVIENTSGNGLFPLMVAGGGRIPIDELREQILVKGFFGYKVFLDWVGNNYGNIRVEDMLTPDEMELANDLSLVIMLHVPRSDRLADIDVQHGVKEYAKRYPKANIILAHCGRCYSPPEMRKAINSVCDLENVSMDTSMVMDPMVLEIALRALGPQRILYGTDFPIAAMRGKRINVLEHWVDIVLDGYPASDYRISTDKIQATFMAYEIAMAVEQAADAAGLTEEQLKRIFFDNGTAILKKVRDGILYKKKDKRGRNE